MIINYLALDIGRARVGLALANSIARIASPLPALSNDDTFLESLKVIVAENQAQEIIIGLPRGLDGQETEQTQYVRDIADEIAAGLGVTPHLQDEALTSVKAENELQSRGKPYEKGDIDSLSAVYILEDYLQDKVQ